MFGSLRKKLKNVIKSVSKTIIKEEIITEPIIREEKKKEEIKPEEVPEKPTIEKPSPIEEGKKSGVLKRIIKKVKEREISEAVISPLLEGLQKILLENDVALETAEKICNDVRQGLVGKKVSRGKVEDMIKESLRTAMLDAMNQEKLNLEEMIEEKYEKDKEPFLIVFLGFNGTGKTTSLAKLAHRLKQYRPILAAADTFRTASIEQLEEHAKNLGLEVVKHCYGADSAAVVFDAKKHAKAIGSKLVLADTAGRSHANRNLMDELSKVCRVNKPDLKILVLDSLTGNDIYNQTRLFNDAVGVDAMILTKTDVYDKGGAALSASHTINKPILFLGTGQSYDDLKEFNPEKIANGLLE